MPSEELLHRSESMGDGLREHGVIGVSRTREINYVKNFISNCRYTCELIYTFTDCIFLQPGHEAHQCNPASFGKALR